MLGNLFGGRAGSQGAANTSAPVSSANLFVGRESLIEAFSRFPRAQNRQRLRVFVVHGAPGLGKSALLSQFREVLASAAPECPHASFNFSALRDSTQAWRETLCALRADLSQQGIAFPRFDLLVGFSLAGEGGDAVLEPLLCPQLQDAARLAANALDVYQNDTNDLWEFAAQTVHNSTQIFPNLENKIVEDDVNAFAEKLGHLCRRDIMSDAGLPSDIVEAFALDFIEGLPLGLMIYPHANEIGEGAIRGALFFDSYEQMWDDRHASAQNKERQLDWWMRDLCAYCLTSGILPVIMGRDRLFWPEDDPDWTETDLEQHELNRLSFTEARLYLAECQIGTAARDDETEFPSALGPGWAEALLPSYNSTNDELSPASSSDLDPMQATILRFCAWEETHYTAPTNTSGAPNLENVGIVRQTGCHPFWLAFCATLILQSRATNKRDPNLNLFSRATAENWEDRLCEAFLKALGNRVLERCLITLSLTPRFDEAALRIQAVELGSSSEAISWEALSNLFFLQYETSGPDALPFLRFHPLIRRSFQVRLKHEEAVEEHLKMQHYWAGRGANELSWFHQWSIDSTTALARWRTDHRTALEAGELPKARAHFALWREIPLDAKDRQKMGDAIWARTHATIARGLLDTQFASPSTAFCLAIDHLQNAQQGYVGSEWSTQRVEVQNQIQQVRHQLLLADAETAMRVGNLERARDNFLGALEYFTPENFPATWCQIQTNLALTYRELPDDAATLAMLELRRDTETNAARAIKHFEKSLQMMSYGEHPDLWGQIQRSLAMLYHTSPGSARISNTRKAISYYQNSLKFYNAEEYPDIWGQTQREMADCYMELRGDDRVQTIQQAIVYYDTALKYFTGEQFPLEHAQLLHDVGIAWGELGYENNDLKAFEVAYSAFEAARTDFQVLGRPEDAEKAREVAEEIGQKLSRLRAAENPES